MQCDIGIHFFQEADADGSGSIDFTEFVELMIKEPHDDHNWLLFLRKDTMITWKSFQQGFFSIISVADPDPGSGDFLPLDLWWVLKNLGIRIDLRKNAHNVDFICQNGQSSPLYNIFLRGHSYEKSSKSVLHREIKM
jgi:hypothetical protein